MIVGVMKSHAIARSDMPPGRDVVAWLMGAMGTAVVMSILVAMIDSFAHAPQRNAGVCTGESQCLLISSSSTQSVSDAPAISSDVVTLPINERAMQKPLPSSHCRAELNNR